MEIKKPSFSDFVFQRSLSDCIYSLACAICSCIDADKRHLLVSYHKDLIKFFNKEFDFQGNGK